MKTTDLLRLSTLSFAAGFACIGCSQSAPSEPSSSATTLSTTSEAYQVEVFPSQKKQQVLGLGVEIQSDSIGSGNNGLPEQPIAVPHDLVESERERMATEMLSGFRYIRLAGGLYWRGLDEEQKHLQPRWPTQLDELKQLMERAGIEGVSFEYWSPTPFWKANRSYVGTGGKDPYNTLRPFVEEFANDPDYKGDSEAFFADFAASVTQDIRTLEQAGIKVSMFGLQNEPWVSNADYSANRYYSPEHYHAAFKPVAQSIRAYDEDIMIFACTGHGYPKFIGPFMEEPETAALVDAYAIHTIGWDAGRVMEADKKIKENLPPRPWFQNEYEYLTGGATPRRTLNTVQHIMNSFQLAENPTWFWLHALKPVSNAEASGYSLGFWNSKLAPKTIKVDSAFPRHYGGLKLNDVPPEFANMEWVYARAGSKSKPGRGYNFIADKDVNVFLLVDEAPGTALDGWDSTGKSIVVDGKLSPIYHRVFSKGKIAIPANTGKVGDQYGLPHAAFVSPVEGSEVKLQIGINQPMYIHSQVMELALLTKDLQPGHWTYNPYNWNAVGSFAKRVPWDSTILSVNILTESNDQAVMVFEKPNGKRTLVISNRANTTVKMQVDSNLANANWKGYRYTPFNAGENTQGVELGSFNGEVLDVALPSLAWDFWEEQ